MGNVELIKKIQDLRKTKVITYITSDRPGINSMIDDTVLRILHDHLKPFKCSDIDLFLYSRGGADGI